MKGVRGTSFLCTYVWWFVCFLGVTVGTSECRADDPCAEFWRAYAENFHLDRVQSLQITCAVERRRSGDSSSRWEIIEGAFQGRHAYVRIYSIPPNLPQSIKDGGFDGSRTGSGGLPPILTACWWCDSHRVVTTTFPRGSWMISPAPPESTYSAAHQPIVQLLRDYGFKSGGPVPPGSTTKIENTKEGCVFIVQTPGYYHHFRFECVGDDAKEGLRSRVTMRGNDGKDLADWRYERWQRFGDVWLPYVMVQRSYLDPLKPDFRSPSEAPTETTTYHLMEARVKGELPEAVFAPSIPQGSEVEDKRFNPPMHYRMSDKLSEADLFEMAREAQIRQKALEEKKKP